MARFAASRLSGIFCSVPLWSFAPSPGARAGPAPPFAGAAASGAALLLLALGESLLSAPHPLSTSSTAVAAAARYAVVRRTDMTPPG
ncbi:hypothetical protein GCM10018962_01780 [Dactylosporangium matsuzakiense]|uniref:Uncharacterized protein n=1 Tax=Dactylosporangium matsuzakiense TaxID=53360 RepID=A0A9W6NKA7_9ACTN|nr:hypothetical protein GCM10017581_016760 [Dactylosporangium matsuzakiense]